MYDVADGSDDNTGSLSTPSEEIFYTASHYCTGGHKRGSNPARAKPDSAQVSFTLSFFFLF
jgi:hypothetical protein